MADKIDSKAEYEKIKKKYKLPDYAPLHKEFELGDIEGKEILLRYIRRKMRDKLIFFCRILEGITYPTERSPLTNYESSAFNDETKLHLSKIHRSMMVFDRQSLLLDIEDSDEKNTEYILSLWKAWPEYKTHLAKVVKTMEKTWQSNVEEETEGYFG